MKALKMSFKLKRNLARLLPRSSTALFSTALKLDQASFPVSARSLGNDAEADEMDVSDLEEPVAQAQQEKFVSRDMFNCIRLRNLSQINSVENIKSQLQLCDDMDLKIFDFIVEKLDLGALLKTYKGTGRDFPLDSVNLLAAYFGSKFVHQEPLSPKKPVISIMGHVDHGKTTLLDFYRKSRIAESEVGGITQKIGGFTLNTDHGQVSFIDTPGHAVFSNMRRTGAFLADIVVLIISAVEGIQPQTEEVLSLIREHKLPFIIAINKIDVMSADPEGVEEKLVEKGVDIEPYGGSVPVVHISAKTGHNLDLLLELLVEESKAIGFKADSQALPECLVLESTYGGDAELKRMSVVVKSGVLKVRAPMVMGTSHFKIMKMTNDLGESVETAFPGDIVEISGQNIFPKSTERVLGMSSEALARDFCDINKNIQELFFKEHPDMIYSDYKVKFTTRKERRKFYGNSFFFKEKMEDTAAQLKQQLNEADEGADAKDDLAKQIEGLSFMLGQMAVVDLENPFMIKVSNMGTLETIKQHLDKIEKKNFTLVDISCGQITETDLKLCQRTKAKILTFDLPKCEQIDGMLKRYEIKCINHNIIYKLFDDIKTLTGLPAPKKASANSKVVGKGVIKKMFEIKGEKGKKVKVAGCLVEDGAFKVKYKYRIVRRNKVVGDNLTLSSMKRFKMEVTSVHNGQDTGISFMNHEDIEEGDLIEAYG